MHCAEVPIGLPGVLLMVWCVHRIASCKHPTSQLDLSALYHRHLSGSRRVNAVLSVAALGMKGASRTLGAYIATCNLRFEVLIPSAKP